MKTLIAALALTIAASAPALAGESFSAHEQRAIAQANSYEVATFGFTGVLGNVSDAGMAKVVKQTETGR